MATKGYVHCWSYHYCNSFHHVWVREDKSVDEAIIINLLAFLVSTTGVLISSQVLNINNEKLCLVSKLIMHSRISEVCCNFRAIEIIESMQWFLGISILVRFIAGIGSAMLLVAATSILMKGTSYSKGTIMVSSIMISTIMVSTIMVSTIMVSSIMVSNNMVSAIMVSTVIHSVIIELMF